MRLFVKVTLLLVGTPDQRGTSELLECPASVGPDTIVSYLTQKLGEVTEAAWTSTQWHPRLACGWIFGGTAEHADQELLCVPLVETGDGSLRPMFELLADQHAEFDELLRAGKLDDYTEIAMPHRAYQTPGDGADDLPAGKRPPTAEPADTTTSEDQGRSTSQPAQLTVCTGGGHRHRTGRAGATEFPATWAEDRVIAKALGIARSPDHVVMHPNQRWHACGVRDGVDIVVAIKSDDTVWSAWPLPGGRGI